VGGHNIEMGKMSCPDNRLTRQDAAWLSVAVIVHLSLLLLPLGLDPPDQRDEQTLSVSLLQKPAPEPQPQPDQPPGEPDEPAAPTVAQAEEPAETRQKPAEPRPVPGNPGEPVTTALLLDSASRLEWPAPPVEADRKLGGQVPRRVPENWRPRITVGENRFNGMTVPATTEIVDRWLAANGSHNVVIETPGGETLCGRARAWDPMRPLIEPVMLFHKCGGGGERTFKMPDRFMRHLVK